MVNEASGRTKHNGCAVFLDKALYTLKCDANRRPRHCEAAAADDTIVFDSPQIKATPFP